MFIQDRQELLQASSKSVRTKEKGNSSCGALTISKRRRRSEKGNKRNP
jgi:hypothetical protein